MEVIWIGLDTHTFRNRIRGIPGRVDVLIVWLRRRTRNEEDQQLDSWPADHK